MAKRAHLLNLFLENPENRSRVGNTTNAWTRLPNPKKKKVCTLA
jgi:hypothetical protein